MGADSWSEITTWREWERLLTMTNHIVVTRPGYELATAHVASLSERISLEWGRLPPPSPRSSEIDNKAPASRRTPKIFLTDIVMNDASATDIRRLASEGRTEELVGLVPGPVLDYIKKYRIYREVNETELNS